MIRVWLLVAVALALGVPITSIWNFYDSFPFFFEEGDPELQEYTRPGLFLWPWGSGWEWDLPAPLIWNQKENPLEDYPTGIQ